MKTCFSQNQNTCCAAAEILTEQKFVCKLSPARDFMHFLWNFHCSYSGSCDDILLQEAKYYCSSTVKLSIIEQLCPYYVHIMPA